MPRPPPRALCLPELISNPQTRADYAQANPPKYGPSASRRSSSSPDIPYPRAPPSPTSTTDVESHRASGATLASLTSPITSTSTRTSLSVHSLPRDSDVSRRSSSDAGGEERKSWGLGSFTLSGGLDNKKPRASWSSAFTNTKSWFGNSTSNEVSTSSQKHSSQKEIKLSPSMIAAFEEPVSESCRPLSSPCPTTSTHSPTSSSDTTRLAPKVGTGLQYYTQRNPAPVHIRFQIPDAIDLQDHDRPQSPLPSSRLSPNAPTPTLTSFNTSAVKELPAVPDVFVHIISPLKDVGMLQGDDTGPLSPPPTPPVHERENNVPHIRVSSGEDL